MLGLSAGARTGIDASLKVKADPADLVQETLLRATKHFSGCRGESEAELAAWLRQILSQVLADLVRKYRTGLTVFKSPSLAVVVVWGGGI